ASGIGAGARGEAFGAGEVVVEHAAIGGGQVLVGGGLKDSGDVARTEPHGAGLVVPALLERRAVNAVVLVAAGVEGGDVRGAHPDFTTLLHALRDLDGTIREGEDHRALESRDVGLAVDHGTPLHTKGLGEFLAQLRLVDVAARFGIRVQQAAVERAPAAVVAVDQVRHKHVGVEVGVAGPARAVAERRTDRTRGADLLDTVGTSTSPERMGFEVVDDGSFDGVVVGGGNTSAYLLIPEGVEERDRLGGGVGVVEAGHRPSPRPTGQEVLAGARIGGLFGDRAEVGAGDLTLEAELGRTGADPLPRRLAGAGVVVLNAAGDPTQVVVHAAVGVVVRPLELPDGKHDPPSPSRAVRLLIALSSGNYRHSQERMQVYASEWRASERSGDDRSRRPLYWGT